MKLDTDLIRQIMLSIENGTWYNDYFELYNGKCRH